MVQLPPPMYGSDGENEKVFRWSVTQAPGKNEQSFVHNAVDEVRVNATIPNW